MVAKSHWAKESARLAERASHPTLTPREITVLGLLAKGMRNKEIAAALGISEGTVPVHMKSIFASSPGSE